MQPDRFTIKTQEAIRDAGRLAEARRNPQATPEHLLAVLLDQADSVVPGVLRKLGVAVEGLRGQVQAALDALPIDPYAAESAGEFFAVASEAFFETPELLAPAYPDVYAQLALFYRQDPRARLSASR